MEDINNTPKAPVKEYWFYQHLQNRIIFIEGEINQDLADTVVKPLQYLMEKSNDPITIYINSEGGNVFEALALLNIIENTKVPINLITLNYSCSMGLLISMCGKNNPLVTRMCYEFSVGLFHAGNLTVSDDRRKAKQYMEFNDKLEDKLKEYTLRNSTVSEEEYDKMYEMEYWLTSDMMLSHGFIDKII